MADEDELTLQDDDPTSFQSATTRRYITLSYWAIIILCIPYWWISTTIERHNIPLDSIAAWQNLGSCPIRLPILLNFQSHNADAQQVIDDLNRSPRAQDCCLDFRIGGAASEQSCHIELASDGPSPRYKDAKTVRIGNENANSLVTDMLDVFAPAAHDHRTAHFSAKYKLVFSLLNEDVSQSGVYDWDASAALQRHIFPLVRSLRNIHHFDVETQIQYYAPLAVERTLTDEGAIIEEDQVKAFVNSADWNLASSVSIDPVLHFILYVPAGDKRPLLVRRENGHIEPLTAFLTPQWGGVYIANPDSTSLPANALSGPFQVFTSQLRTLLGVPSLPGGGDAAASWAIEALKRDRTVQAAKEATERLGAIARQVNEIQNMRIPLAVQQDVQTSLDALAKVQDSDSTKAMNQSSIALIHAKRASFNHEMLALLYFPDEHKWAVYTPLFGPIAVPLLVALNKEIKEWKKRRSVAKKKQKAE